MFRDLLVISDYTLFLQKKKQNFIFHLQICPLSAIIQLLWIFTQNPMNGRGGATMAKCAICEKAAHFGNAVSHSHRRSNKMWKANVKSVKVKVNGGAQKMYVCTSCLRSGKVERA